jgi:hypothetical protein
MAAACVVVALAATLPAFALSQTVRDLFGFGVSHPPVARNWVKATLTSKVPLRAKPGTLVRVSWKLWGRDQQGHVQPFSGGGIFGRLVNPSDTMANSASAQGRDGRYTALVRVPRGGIGRVEVGIRGFTNGPQGTQPAPVLFPITNDPFHP